MTEIARGMNIMATPDSDRQTPTPASWSKPRAPWQYVVVESSMLARASKLEKEMLTTSPNAALALSPPLGGLFAYFS